MEYQDFREHIIVKLEEIFDNHTPMITKGKMTPKEAVINLTAYNIMCVIDIIEEYDKWKSEK